MVKVIAGERLGKNGHLLVGCSATIFDARKQKILLARRSDDGKWCVPGGAMRPGESFSEACAREVLEETGLIVKVKRLISIYTSPHRLLTYPDGNRWQAVVFHFQVDVAGGQFAANEEMDEFGYFSPAETENLEMHGMDRARVLDSFSGKAETIIHDDYPV